jgi:hypothetical protein
VVDAHSADLTVQGVRRLNEVMAADPVVSATAIQTVGADLGYSRRAWDHGFWEGRNEKWCP